MAVKYTEEQLNTVDKSLLIHLLLQQQEQLEALTKELHASNEKMQLLMEQVILGKQNRFGRSSEKMDDTSQISFREVDGTIVFFNEAEAVCDLSASEPENLELKSSKQPKCILRSLADSDAFQSGRCAAHNGRPETLAIIN